jgi:hypothetical protein
VRASRLQRNRSRWLLGLVTALAALAPPALAQRSGDEEPQPPFDVQGLSHTRQWVPWVMAFLFAGATIAIAFKNPHRSHLD